MVTQIIPKTLEEIKEVRLKEKELEKIAPTTGYTDLDRLIKGFVPGHLYTLTGDSNIGKSSLASNFAVNVAKQGKHVLYVALEPENTIIDYMASVVTDKTFDELTPDDLNFDIKIDIFGKENVPSLERLLFLIKSLPRYDLIIVDHIGYFITSQNNYLQQQSNSIKQLVGIAKEMKTAIMIIAHLRKRGKGDKKAYVPTSDDISGSGAFKQDSTEVLIATRGMKSDDPDEVQYSNEGHLYVTKTKCGPNGRIPLGFSERKAKITSGSEFDSTIQEIFGSVPS